MCGFMERVFLITLLVCASVALPADVDEVVPETRFEETGSVPVAVPTDAMSA